MKERVSSYIRKHGMMRPGERIAVAVSGGADSVALLRLLLEMRAELGIVISVVHFNHKIRGAEADADEQFVCALARGFDLELYCESADTPAYARDHKRSLEAAGRELRYQFFCKLVSAGKMHRIATAHTRDDQAETVLLRFLRGSGTRGLAAIYPELRLPTMHSSQQVGHRELPGGLPWIVRPLLVITREELRAYLTANGQAWREDASNTDVSFARNRVRRDVIPLLRELNPRLEEALAETAEIARAEEEYWQQQAGRVLRQSGSIGAVIRLDALRAQPLAMQRRLIRAVAEQHGMRLEFHHVQDVLGVAAGAGGHTVELPREWEAVRSGGELRFRNRGQKKKEEGPGTYDVALPVPGEVEVAGRKLRAELVGRDAMAGRYDPSRVLLDAAAATRSLRVRNWRAGDRYWPSHTKEAKKVKELLQAPHIPRARKPLWPVVVAGEEIIWVPGFAGPEGLQVRENDDQVLLLEQVPLGETAQR